MWERSRHQPFYPAPLHRSILISPKKARVACYRAICSPEIDPPHPPDRKHAHNVVIYNDMLRAFNITGVTVRGRD